MFYKLVYIDVFRTGAGARDFKAPLDVILGIPAGEGIIQIASTLVEECFVNDQAVKGQDGLDEAAARRKFRSLRWGCEPEDLMSDDEDMVMADDGVKRRDELLIEYVIFSSFIGCVHKTFPPSSYSVLMHAPDLTAT